MNSSTIVLELNREFFLLDVNTEDFLILESLKRNVFMEHSKEICVSQNELTNFINVLLLKYNYVIIKGFYKGV